MSTTTTRENTSSPSSSVVKLTVVRKGGAPHREQHHHTPDEQHHHHASGEAEQHGGSFTLLIPAAPLTFVFARQRMWAGLRFLAASALALGIGIFLVTQIATSPALKFQVGMAASICVILGLALLPLAARDLLGKLRIDSQGIRMSPSYLGFNIPWSDLTEWDVNGVTFQFKSVKRKHVYTTDFESLSSSERLQLQGTLQGCVPAKEGRVLRKQNS